MLKIWEILTPDQWNLSLEAETYGHNQNHKNIWRPLVHGFKWIPLTEDLLKVFYNPIAV